MYVVFVMKPLRHFFLHYNSFSLTFFCSPVVYFDKLGRVLPKSGISQLYSLHRRGSIRPDSLWKAQKPALSSSLHATASSKYQKPGMSTGLQARDAMMSQRRALSTDLATTSKSQRTTPISGLQAKATPSKDLPATTSESHRCSVHSSRPTVTQTAVTWDSESSGSDLDDDNSVDVSGSNATPPFRTSKIPHKPNSIYETTFPTTPVRNPVVSGVSASKSGLTMARVPSKILRLPQTPHRTENGKVNVSVGVSGNASSRVAQIPSKTNNNPTISVSAINDLTCSPITPEQLHNTAVSLSPRTPANCTVLGVSCSPDTPVQLHNTHLPTPDAPMNSCSTITPAQTHNTVVPTSSSYSINRKQRDTCRTGVQDAVVEYSIDGPSTSSSHLSNLTHDSGSNATDFTHSRTNAPAIVSTVERIPKVLHATSDTFPRVHSCTVVQNASCESKVPEETHRIHTTPDGVPAYNTRYPTPDTTISTATITTTQHNTGTLPKRLCGKPTSL